MTMTKNTAAICASILLLLAGRLQAQTYTLAPAPYQTEQNTSGAIVVNGCIWTYAAGTTTPIATYTDTSGTLNGNPIIADSSGRFVAYLLPGTNYKFVYELTPCSAPSTHGTVLKTQDNIQGVPASSANVDIGGTAGEALSAGQCAYLSDGSGSKTPGQWYKCDSANTYSSTLPTVGLPVAAIASATTGTFRVAGSITGLSSLTAGAPFYVSNTPGTLTGTAPANRRLVGNADTTTSLIVAANPALMTAAASGTASSTTFLRGDQAWSTPWTPVATTSTGTQSGAWVTLTGNTIIRANNASLLTIAGLPAGYDGQHVKVYSVGAGEVDTAHQSGSEASAAARLINAVTSGITPLAAGSGAAEYVYDATTARWRLVSHEQGAWITPATPTFSGNGGMTWTPVTVTTERYVVRGRTLILNFDFNGTVVAPLSTQLTFTLPNSYTAGSTAFGVYDNNLLNLALSQSTTSSNLYTLLKDATAAGNFVAGATRTLGTVSIELQ